MSDVGDGDTRSAHEIALGYSITDWWKTELAIEIENDAGETAELEAFEFENTLLLPFLSSGGHSHDDKKKGKKDENELEFVLGIYTALEILNDGGLNEGAVEVGPIAEIGYGPINVVGNFFFEIPLEDGVDTGIEYALAVSTPINDQFAVGFEAFGEVEEAFGDSPELGDTEHSIGPAVYGNFDIGRDRFLEPRVAALFGVTDESPDAVISVNLELKF